MSATKARRCSVADSFSQAALFELVDLLNEHDGERGTYDFAESLKVISTAMNLTGSA